MLKFYTVDNGIINRVRVDETTRTLYVAKLGQMEQEAPGYNDYDDDDEEEHDFVKYYTQHDDVLPWHEIEVALPYKKIFLAKDEGSCAEFSKQIGEHYVVSALLEMDMDRISQDVVVMPAVVMPAAAAAYPVEEKVKYMTAITDILQECEEAKDENIKASVVMKMLTYISGEALEFTKAHMTFKNTVINKCYELKQINMPDIVEIADKTLSMLGASTTIPIRTYAFIGGDIKFFSTRNEIVKFRCELGNSAALNPFAYMQPLRLKLTYEHFDKCIGYERDSVKPLRQADVNDMLRTVAATPNF